MTKTTEWKKTQPGSTEAVQFSDGMLVTADDLTAAMRYPLNVIQVLLKAYFGCGIVCGLDLKNPAEGQVAETTHGEPGSTPPQEAGRPAKCDLNFILTVEKGVALGCDGYPIEICGPLKLDLTPDPCRHDTEPKTMFVATRRVPAAEAAARSCGCGSTGGEPAQQCTRMRDHALVQAFEEDHPVLAEICRIAPAKDDSDAPAPVTGKRTAGATAGCDCMKQCGECGCRGEPWVLLGSVMVSEQGLGTIDRSGRRYVKPIACNCDTVERDRDQPETPGKPNTNEDAGTRTRAREATAV
jgi:hypothetical protein